MITSPKPNVLLWFDSSSSIAGLNCIYSILVYSYQTVGALIDYPQRIRVCLSIWIQYLLDCMSVSKFYHLSPHPPLFSSGTEFQIIGPRPEYPQTTVDKGASAFEFRLWLIACVSANFIICLHIFYVCLVVGKFSNSDCQYRQTNKPTVHAWIVVHCACLLRIVLVMVNCFFSLIHMINNVFINVAHL